VSRNGRLTFKPPNIVITLTSAEFDTLVNGINVATLAKVPRFTQHVWLLGAVGAEAEDRSAGRIRTKDPCSVALVEEEVKALSAKFAVLQGDCAFGRVDGTAV
jgi:hypothetical protein